MKSKQSVVLSEVIDLITGGTPKTSIEEYWGGDIPWISIKDIGNDNQYVFTTEKFITNAGLKNSSTKLLQKNDIIISARGTVGELALIPFKMAFNQSCYGIRPKNDKVINSIFLYYLLKNSIQRLKLSSHGTVFDTITKDTFKSLVVEIPDISEQETIAKYLSVIDEKIQLNRQINHHLEAVLLLLILRFLIP